MAYGTAPDLVASTLTDTSFVEADVTENEPKNRTAIAAACLVGASAIWAFQDVAIKDLISGMAVWQVPFVRSICAMLVFLALGMMPKFRPQLRPGNLKPHVIRAGWILVSYTTFYLALPYVPMSDIATLVYSAPIMITVLSIPLLGEKVGLHRGAAVVVGFFGIAVISGMGQSFNPWILWPLLSAFAYAMCMITVRKSGGFESALSLTMSLNMGFLLISVIMIIAGEVIPLTGDAKETWGHMLGPWVWPDTRAWAMIIALSVLGVIGHFLITTGYLIAEASAVAVFDYTYIVLAALAAYIMLGEEPGMRSYIGMGLIVIAGIYVAVRERIVAQRRQRRAAGKRLAA